MANRLATPTSPTAILLMMQAQLDALTARVDTLECRQRGPRDDDDRAAVLAVVEHLCDQRFTTRDVLRFARAVPSLQAALEHADADTPRALGHLFRRVEGHVSGVDVRRVSETRGSIVWTVRVLQV